MRPIQAQMGLLVMLAALAGLSNAGAAQSTAAGTALCRSRSIKFIELEDITPEDGLLRKRA